MMRSKFLILCTVLTVGLVFATGCSRDGNNNDTQAPYEDETNNDVNGGAVDDMESSGNNLQDAGKNLVDSIQDAGSAIMDGVDNMGDGANSTNNTNNANSTNRNGQ